MQHCHVKFKIASLEQMERLTRVVKELRHDKEAGQFRSDEEWKQFFSAEELQSFWWPSDEERDEWQRRWFSTPVETRFSDPTLQLPWDFSSMLDSIRDGEYSLIGVRAEGPQLGVLEFDPEAYPFGGTGCLRALILAYGHTLVGYDDGTGFTETTVA